MDEQQKSTTSPPDKTHEATTPPGQGDLDRDALEKSKDALYRASGGY